MQQELELNFDGSIEAGVCNHDRNASEESLRALLLDSQPIEHHAPHSDLAHPAAMSRRTINEPAEHFFYVGHGVPFEVAPNDVVLVHVPVTADKQDILHSVRLLTGKDQATGGKSAIRRKLDCVS